MSIPPIDPEKIPWDVYRGLHSSLGPHSSKDLPIPEDVKTKLRTPLTLDDFKSWNFEGYKNETEAETEALILCVKGMAMLNIDPASREDWKAWSYLLVGKTLVWLAGYYHHSLGTPQPPAKVKVYLTQTQGMTMAKMVDSCLKIASFDPNAKALALIVLARIMISQVAKPQPTGPFARPRLAEGWICAGEAEVMLSEIEAALAGPKASGWIPPGRKGPDRGENVDKSDDWNKGWKISVPFVNSTASKTKLANYWNGQPSGVAALVGCHILLQAFQHKERYKALASKEQRGAMWEREQRIEKELARRGAQALSNLDHDSAKTNDPRMRQMVSTMRLVYPGSPFEPTEEFVKTLKYKLPADPTEEKEFTWHVSCTHGALGGGPNRTMITITDIFGRYYNGILGGKIYEGPKPDQTYVPPAFDLYMLLLKAMAGAGDEARAHVGPPRRPFAVIISYRLNSIHSELSEFLSKVQVNCVLDTVENLKLSNFRAQTNSQKAPPAALAPSRVTAPMPHQAAPAPAAEDDFVDLEDDSISGQIAGLVDLKNNSLNGRIGQILRWKEAQSSWEVKLQCILPDENPLTLSIKPENLIACPLSIVNDTSAYQQYKDSIGAINPGDRSNQVLAGHLFEKVQNVGEAANDDDICIICRENVGEHADDWRFLDIGHGTKLPCNHSFHKSCLLGWITEDSSECPCCRNPIS
jgi:hypothetical protein